MIRQTQAWIASGVFGLIAVPPKIARTACTAGDIRLTLKASVRKVVLAGLLLLGATIAPAQATEVYSVIQSGSGDAGLVSFDIATGANHGGAGLKAGGATNFGFGDIGGIAFAPDGTFYAVVQSGSGDAGLVSFDIATGDNHGGAGLKAGGATNFGFGDIGGIAFAREEAPVTGVVPEPASWILMMGGLVALGFSRRRRSVSHRVGQNNFD